MGHINSKLKVEIKKELQKLQNVLTTEDTDKINKFLEDIEKSNLFSKIARVEIISNSGTFEGVPLFEEIYQNDLEDVQLLGQFYTQFVAAYDKVGRGYKTSINNTLSDLKKRFKLYISNVNQVASTSTSSSSSTSHSSSKSSKEEKKDDENDKPKNNEHDQIGPIVSSKQEAMVIINDILKKYKLTKPDKTTLKKLLNNYPGIGNEIYFEQGNALALIICKGVTSLVQFWIDHGYTQPVFVDYLKSDYLKGLKQIKSEVASSLKKIQWLASSSSSSTSQDEEMHKNSSDAKSEVKTAEYVVDYAVYDEISNDIFTPITPRPLSFSLSDELFDKDLVDLVKQGHAAIATINSQYSFKDRNVLSEGDINQVTASDHVTESKKPLGDNTRKLSSELYQLMDEVAHLVDVCSDITITSSTHFDSKCHALYNKIDSTLLELTKQIPLEKRKEHVITKIDAAFHAAKKNYCGKDDFKLTDKDNKNNTQKSTELNYSITFYRAFHLQLAVREVFEFLNFRKLIDRLNYQVTEAKKITQTISEHEFDKNRANEEYSVLFNLINKTISELEEKMPLVKQQQYGIDTIISAFNGAKTTYTIKKIFDGKSGTKEISMIGNYKAFFKTFIAALNNRTIKSNSKPIESKATQENKKQQKDEKQKPKSKKRKQATQDEAEEKVLPGQQKTSFGSLQFSDRSSVRKRTEEKIKQILRKESDDDVYDAGSDDESRKKRRRIDESSSSSSSSVSTLSPRIQQKEIIVVSDDENQEPMETKKATRSNVDPIPNILQQMIPQTNFLPNFWQQQAMYPMPYLLPLPMFNPMLNMEPFGSFYPPIQFPLQMVHTINQQFFGMPPQLPMMLQQSNSSTATVNTMLQQSNNHQTQPSQISSLQQVSMSDVIPLSSLLNHNSSLPDMATDKLSNSERDMPPLENGNGDSFNSAVNRLGFFAMTDNATSELNVDNKNIFNDDCDPFGFLK